MGSSDMETAPFKHFYGPQAQTHLPPSDSTGNDIGEHVYHTSLDTDQGDCVEEGDPLQNDKLLLQGVRIAEPGDDGPNTIRKVPSDQLLPMFRWGSSHRMTGRSKSGLQILVPRRDVPATVVSNGPYSEKSIIYTYASSSDSSGKTINSFGSVGDHQSTGRKGALSGSKHLAVPKDQSVKLAIHPTSAGRKPRSPLADLVADSTPDAGPYKILIKGEKGPCTKFIMPRVVSLRDFPLLPPRRRSLSDLIEDVKSLHSPTSIDIPTPAGSEVSTATENLSSERAKSSCQGVTVQLTDPENSIEPIEAPVWHLSGPPFVHIQRRGAGAHIQNTCLPSDFDPPTFRLPFGSKVFVMKSPDIHSLRASVIAGVWSSSKGANRVLQNAWDAKAEGEKIVFLFSISHSHLFSGKYCGMAEMSGPYDPDVDPQFWIEGLKGTEGIIPMRWIVTKDVEFSVFVDLKYKGKFVTQLRHANTVPGEAGRSLVQAYFEAQHPTTSILHPEGHRESLLSSTPFRAPVKPRKWPAPRTATYSRRRSLKVGPNTSTTPGLGPHPAYGLGQEEHRDGFSRDVPPPPPLYTGVSRSSAFQDSFTPNRPYRQTGPNRTMTPHNEPHTIRGPAKGAPDFSYSNVDYAATSYPSTAPSLGQSPFNSTPRLVPRSYVNDDINRSLPFGS